MDSRPIKRLLVSACLAGIDCTNRGKNNLNKRIEILANSGHAIALCPEVFGMLGVPRESAEIVDGDGSDVIDGRARVISSSGKDLTRTFLVGARKVLEIVKRYDIEEAILKSKSPSCAVGRIYDGTFTGTLKDGDGVLTALLKRNGLKVITEKESTSPLNP